jgi:hypothetical protein
VHAFLLFSLIGEGNNSLLIHIQIFFERYVMEHSYRWCKTLFTKGSLHTIIYFFIFHVWEKRFYPH